MKRLTERWLDVRSAAKSSDPFDRTFALSTAVTCLEVALAALGVERRDREGVQSRIRRWADQNGKPEFCGDEYRAAFEARNAAIHEQHVVAEPEKCKKHVAALFDVWSAMRRVYVTRDNAATLAEGILDAHVVTDIFLFGSLARRAKEPKDVDLLLFDEGDVSALNWRGYSSADILVESEFFDTSSGQRAALECGWLDYVFVDGTRFGEDPSYTVSLCQSHRDPLFMINIADSLLWFDRQSRTWVNRRPQVFERLGNLRRLLETENVVGEYRRTRRRLTSR
jgi:hypothetical protein